MFNTAKAVRASMLALIEPAALPHDGSLGGADDAMATLATDRARAAHDRIDRLLLGAGEAARRRIERLIGEQPKAHAIATPAMEHATEEVAAVAIAVGARARLETLLAPLPSAA